VLIFSLALVVVELLPIDFTIKKFAKVANHSCCPLASETGS
jgi:hypothetical protein